MNAYGGNLDMASADIRSYTEQGRAVAVVCGSVLRCQNMLDALTDTGLNVKISDLLPKGGCVNIMVRLLELFWLYDIGITLTCMGVISLCFAVVYITVYRFTAKTYYKIVKW